jgi:hypothetical protein
MRSSGKGSGGGLGSKNVVRPGGRNGAAARGVNPGHANQIGPALGNRAMEKQTNYRGEPKFTQSPKSVPLGNEVAKNVGGGGPGAGRTVMGSGSQGQHGGVAGSVKPAGRDILNEFGNDSASVRGRR